MIGGTFTITNPGPYGTLMTLPIINQPQVAILSTDGISKKPVVVEGPDGGDAIAIRPVGRAGACVDHRAFDGVYAAGFLHAIRQVLETRDWAAELGASTLRVRVARARAVQGSGRPATRPARAGGR